MNMSSHQQNPNNPAGYFHFLKVYLSAIICCLIILLFPQNLGAAQAQELRLVTSQWPPSNYVDEQGEPTGLSVEVVHALKKILNVSTPVEVLPWARGYLTAKSKPNVMLFTAGQTQERRDMGFQFIGPVVMWNHVLMAAKGSSLELAELEEVLNQDLTVAGVRGSWQLKLLQDAGAKTVATEGHETNVRMLMAGRVDLWITSQLQASVLLRELQIPQEAVKPVYTVRRSPSYLMLSKGSDPLLIAQWRAAYEKLLQTDFFEKTAMNWSGKLGIPLRFEPSEGFYADTQLTEKTGS
jgi:polar amino acid transport system substrate-binding protein